MIDTFGEANAVAVIGLLGGIVLGLAARMGRFCTLGAIEDTLYASDTRRLRMWGIAIGTAIIGTHLAMASGAVEGTETLYLSTQWNPLASIFGGLMFGYGMALCGTCGYGALARLGGGDLRSLVVVLVMGLSAAFVLSGPLAQARVWAFPIQPAASPQGLGGLLRSTFGITPLLTGLVLGGALCAICLLNKPMMRATGHMFWGVVVGLAIVSGWLGTAWITAHGFEALPVESHTFAAPLAGTIFYAMTASGTALSFSVGSVMGVLVGACMGSWAKGQFRWEACEDPRELRRQMLGAALMGVGAVLALGCTVGQGISAFSVLAFSAPVTFVAIFLGAMFGLRQLITGFAPAR